MKHILTVLFVIILFSCKKEEAAPAVDPFPENASYTLTGINSDYFLDANDDGVFTKDELFSSYSSTSLLVLDSGSFTWDKLIVGQAFDQNDPPLFWDAMMYSRVPVTATYTKTGNTIVLSYDNQGTTETLNVTLAVNKLILSYDHPASRYVYRELENGATKSNGVAAFEYEYTR